MIIRHHGSMEIFFIIWMTIVVAAQSQNATNNTETTTSTTTTTTANPSTVAVQEDNTTSLPSTTESPTEEPLYRRAPRFDTAESAPWVRVYNRPPGTRTDFNYETRGNTSGHTSVEGWDIRRKDSNDPLATTFDRRESKVHDFLRVKPKIKDSATTLVAKLTTTTTTTEKPTTKSQVSTTKETVAATTVAASTKNDSNNKGYIAWSSSNGGPMGGWSFDNPRNKINRELPTAESTAPKDGTHWKVVGDGGDDGWQVLDDKGDVEWKIEYDDGEWRVTSTGDLPIDAEWVDPEDVWGEGPLSDEEEYNSWSSEDYSYSPWVEPALPAIKNSSVDKADDGISKLESLKSLNSINSKEKPSHKDYKTTKEPIRFGARRKSPDSDSSKAQDRTDPESNNAADDSVRNDTDRPQSDRAVVAAKSWFPPPAAVGPPPAGQQWVQGFGAKSWEADDTGFKSGFGGETWITKKKDFTSGSWVPKTSAGPETASKIISDAAPKAGVGDVRAWGTGYGSKTWQGDEWDSNVVWKTGVGSGALPQWQDNSSWKFPERSSGEDYDDGKKPQGELKPIVWSQPLPSKDSESEEKSPVTTSPKSKPRIRWPTKGSNILWKTPPSRRTEGESWSDDASEGGVVWKGQESDTSTDSPEVLTAELPDSAAKGWPNGWLNSQVDGSKTVTPLWKSYAPPQKSNLISVKWTSDESATDSPPVIWSDGQWFGGDPNNFPPWLYNGCKFTVKCGSTESDESDDTSEQATTPQTTTVEDTTIMPTDAPETTVSDLWPAREFKGKSWKPPTKSWRPPPKSWKPPKKKSWRPPSSKQPPPTMPDMPPPTDPTPMMWKKPSKSPWKPPSPPKWKRPRPPKSWRPSPTKSWRPPPTKSWKPPTAPSIVWQPSIATPAPDVWTTQTKPDCKEATESSPETTTAMDDTTEDDMGPPQIIIITKLPGSVKDIPLPPSEKKDTKENTKNKKVPGKSWVFPPRKGPSKGTKHRKDKTPGSPNRWPVKSKKAPASFKFKAWPKSLPPSYFYYPGSSTKKRTSKKPSQTTWKPPKYMKSKAWRQFVKKWMNARM